MKIKPPGNDSTSETPKLAVMRGILKRDPAPLNGKDDIIRLVNLDGRQVRIRIKCLPPERPYIRRVRFNPVVSVMPPAAPVALTGCDSADETELSSN